MLGIIDKLIHEYTKNKINGDKNERDKNEHWNNNLKHYKDKNYFGIEKIKNWSIAR